MNICCVTHIIITYTVDKLTTLWHVDIPELMISACVSILTHGWCFEVLFGLNIFYFDRKYWVWQKCDLSPLLHTPLFTINLRLTTLDILGLGWLGWPFKNVS